MEPPILAAAGAFVAVIGLLGTISKIRNGTNWIVPGVLSALGFAVLAFVWVGTRG